MDCWVYLKLAGSWTGSYEQLSICSCQLEVCTCQSEREVVTCRQVQCNPCRVSLFPANIRDSTGSSPKSRQRQPPRIIRSEAVRTRRIRTRMSSSYPPPPPSTTDGNALIPDTAQQGPDAHAYTGHPQFITDAAAAAVAAAHHGLQALQAAVAAPAPVPSPSPVTPHHAPLPDASSLGSAGTSLGPSNALSPHNPKATRLRRACDMCSQRKVKVCPPLMRS